MKRYVFEMFRVVMLSSLMVPMVSCENEIDDKSAQGTGETEDLFVNAVDLGLSVRWAEHNVGATQPEEPGGYYAWGEIEEKKTYSEETYLYFGNGFDESIGLNISGTEYDVAHMKWGKDWRMPTLSEIRELCDKCSWLWTSVNGVNGCKVTGPNGNSIFLPATGNRYNTEVYGSGSVGYYWSGTLRDSDDAFYIAFEEGDWWWDDTERPCGFSIRPVKD